MYDASERVKQVKLRAHKKLHKNNKRVIGFLYVICAALFGGISLIMADMTDGGQGLVQNLSGTSMTLEESAGYVFVGVIAFISAVIITVSCMRYNDKDKDDKK